MKKLFIAALFLAGCAPQYQYIWREAGSGPYEKDIYECQRDADQHFQGATRNVGSINASIASSMIEHQCMEARGWRRIPANH